MQFLKQFMAISIATTALAMIAGCSDNDDEDSIVVSDAAIYRGYMSLNSDEEAAEMEAVIGYNGQSTVSLYATDGKRANTIFRGTTIEGTTTEDTATENVSTLTFNDSTADASFSLSLDDGKLTGTFTSTRYNGDVSMTRDTASSSLPASLDTTAGSFAFKDDQQQLWSLSIADNGAISASSASCSFSGQLTVINAEINTYGITLGGATCAPFTESLSGTAYLIAIEGDNDALRVAAAGSSESWDIEWLRL